MKKPILILSLSFFVIGAFFITCQSRTTEEDKIRNKEQDAKKDLAEFQTDSVNVLLDSIEIYQKFINESENTISLNEKNIADIKAKIAVEKKEEKSRYEKKIAQLEQKNIALKIQIENYKTKQIKDWKNIQLEFTKDLDELGNAIVGFFD